MLFIGWRAKTAGGRVVVVVVVCSCASIWEVTEMIKKLREAL